MKRGFALMIAALVMLCTPAARGAALPLAATADANISFERFQSYALDGQTGDWSAHGRIAQQLLATVEQGGASGYMAGGVCVLYPGARGNRDLSLMEPVLYVCLLRASPIKAQALSIATGGARYDFVGKPVAAKIGDYACERFALPLDQDGLALLRSFADQGGAVRVYGETRVFGTAICEADQYKSKKLRTEALSVAAVRDFLALWPDGYALWDRNAAYWQADRPRMARVALREGGYGADWPALDPATQCLDQAKGAAVRAYQQLLRDKAFFTSGVDGVYGKLTRAATRQAQQYYGLLPTGMADRVLIERLYGIQPPAAPPAPPTPTQPLADGAAQPGVTYVLDGQLSLRLDRAWAAYSLSPTHASGQLDRLSPADRSNRLYIADGEIVNLSDAPMQVGAVLQGYALLGGIRYPGVVQCERDEGRGLGNALLPMGASRLVIACEAPGGLDLTSCAFRLDIQAPGQTLSIQFD